MSTISERLQMLRKEQSRRSFAELLGIPPSTLKNYEQGDTSPSIETLEALCEKLSINKKWLMLGEGEPYGTENPEAPLVSSEAKDDLLYLQTRNETLELMIKECEKRNAYLEQRNEKLEAKQDELQEKLMALMDKLLEIKKLV